LNTTINVVISTKSIPCCTEKQIKGFWWL